MVFGLAENHGDLVHIDGIKLQKVNCCKYLGIFIDCNMKWSELENDTVTATAVMPRHRLF